MSNINSFPFKNIGNKKYIYPQKNDIKYEKNLFI